MSCRLCGGGTAPPRAMTERMFGTGEQFLYEDCTRCGSAQIVQVPFDLGRHYPTDYYSNADPVFPSWFATMEVEILASAVIDAQLGQRPITDPEVQKQLAALVPRTLLHYLPEVYADPARRVLDVGCGRGSFVEALTHAGCTEVFGIDRFVRSSNPRILPGVLDDLEGCFDHVLFQHSLEHLEDPAAALHQAACRLSPGGSIVVRIPLVDNHLVTTFGDDWFGYEPPRHLFSFSERGFRSLVAGAGLEVRAARREQNLWSVLATEQWIGGRHAMHKKSLLVDPESAEDPFVFSEARARSSDANRTGRGDQGVFWLVNPASVR